ncbi:MAG: hypothetical protein IAA97_01785 [Spirochaetes bacterium]|uniref:SLH domain-containing protein n=1 Tax=Candidatus Ornithospirochaeta stercoripullorum TaxID=2840899 RepID=A0A9D9H589_9SPIO|nr:hypothetical protein [Candidatus Ornithospirochaeta stercoripullorum]
MKTRKIIMFALCIVMSLSLFAAGDGTFALDTYEKNSAYLSQYFGIEIASDTVSLSDFAKDLSAVTGTEIVEPATEEGIINIVVAASGFDELAKTYSAEKAAARLEKYGVENASDPQYAAAALDSGVLSAEAVNGLVAAEGLSSEEAASLLMAVAYATGKGRNYIGFAGESDIQARIENVFKNVGLYSNDELDAIGALLVETGASTGYNLKRESDNARFLDSLTLRYGHDTKDHVKQLVALLVSEDINALIQIEPKTSIYEYLLDWGPVPEPTPTYRVEQYSEDLYLVHATEFDLELEFDTIEDLQKFDAVVNQYSKKNDANQAEGSGVNLILGAWWQPLYSARFNPDENAYTEIVDNVLYSADGAYSIHPFTTVENSASLIATEEELSENGSTFADHRYVNNAFYRYLTGTDYQ